MAKIGDWPFTTGSNFSTLRAIYSNGIYDTGAALSDGIPGRIWIEDDACHMYLDTSDAATLNWKRTECEFGFFPTAFGEYWTTFDFMYEWSFPNFVVIGEWAPMISGEYGVTYATLGFRVQDHCFLVQAQREYSQLSFNSRIVCKVPIRRGSWYRVCTHINLQSDGRGFLEILLNGETVAREWNRQTAHADVSDHYFKIGPYDGNHTELFKIAKMRLRNVTIWSGNDGYQAVMGGGVPLSPKRLLRV